MFNNNAARLPQVALGPEFTIDVVPTYILTETIACVRA